MSLLYCFNKGCNQKFDPENNKEDSCQFHAGAPVFHDAIKSWSCCTKKKIDFSEFLNIPGCTRGFHSNIKPAPVESSKPDPSTVTKAPPQPNKSIRPPNNPNERPSLNESRIELKKTIGASLKQALDKQMENLTLQTDETVHSVGDMIHVGTVCKNSACGKTYSGPESNNETCTYHPGGPIFHEGYKYWSCCQKKTVEFDNFLQQVGCQSGHHVWIKHQEAGEKKSCRFDWHQTGSTVNISVYSKIAIPEKCHIEANRVSCDVTIVFEGGKSLFEQTFVFCGIIDPTKSDVKMLGTKVEINLKKGEMFHWPNLESPLITAKGES